MTQYYLTSGTELRSCEAMDKMINEALDRHNVPHAMTARPDITYTTLGRVLLVIEYHKMGLKFTENDNDNQNQ